MPLDRQVVASLRTEFPALGRLVNGRPAVFFDGPGGTQAHGSVIEAMSEYFAVGNSYSHGAFSLSRATDDVVSAARSALSAFVNAESPDEIVFGPNMTTLTFQVSRAFGRTLRKGDEVVVTQLDHDANVAPWLALQAGGHPRSPFRADDCTLDLSEMESSITSRTKLVAVGMPNAVGTERREGDRRDGSRGRRPIYVDAVHYAPHGPIDVQALDCTSGLLGPQVLRPHPGVLYGRRICRGNFAYDPACVSENRPTASRPTLPFDALAGATAAVGYLASVGQRFGDWRTQPKTGPVCALVSRPDSPRSDPMRPTPAAPASGLAEIAGIKVYGSATRHALRNGSRRCRSPSKADARATSRNS
jgi:selenocysteine lyase/cysteine desulfurase